jgi:AraC-like DNA-binding protein
LLCEPEITIAEVAQRVGYGSAFALSAAFKRERGISPQQHRDRAREIPHPAGGVKNA